MKNKDFHGMITRMLRSKWIQIIVMLIILGAAIFFRTFELSLKPIHHDEAVNYYFLSKLIEEHDYQYNPTAYHGPILYFSSLPFNLGEITKITLRIVPAIAGVAAVLAILLFSTEMGFWGAVAGGILLSISPADVYFSRTFIHEIFYTCFAAWSFWCLVKFGGKGSKRALLFLPITLVLCFASKETTPIWILALAVSSFMTIEIRKILPRYQDASPFELSIRSFANTKHSLIDGIGISLTLWILLFSSFFLNPRGVLKSFLPYIPWIKIGFIEHTHDKSFWYFCKILYAYYWAPLIFCIPGIFASFRKNHGPGLLAFFTFLSSLLIYSSIPYKTPWCVLTIALPIFVLAGVGAQVLFELGNAGKAALFAGLCFIIPAYSFQSWNINFDRYDDDSEKIVYVQTPRKYEQMFVNIDKVAAADGRGFSIPMLVIDAKNPCRFYLRHYRDWKFTKEVPEIIDRPIIMTKSDLLSDVILKLPGPYIKNKYESWPGTSVYLLIEKSLAEKAGIELDQIK